MVWSDYKNLLLSPVQMRAADQAAINKFGIPGLILMENAAAGIAEYIISYADDLMKHRGGRNVLVVCGKGNNGGDGFAAARKLHLRGFSINIIAIASKGEIQDDAGVNLGICERLGLDMVFIPDCSGSVGDILTPRIARSDLIVDAMFGTGYRGSPVGAYEAAINAINGSGKTVVSIDIPSGLDGLTGVAAGACVQADVTLALGFIKTGLISGPDTEKASAVELIDIGIPCGAIDIQACGAFITDRRCAAPLSKTRRRDAHKGDFGRIMIITGSPGMTGAGCLAAEAALTAGAGLVYLAAPGGLAQIYETSVREAITLQYGFEGDRIINCDGADAIINHTGRMDAVAIGPGMSTDPDAARAILQIIAAVQKPMVIDADALTAVASDISVLKNLNAPAVLTPHEAEMGRLLGISASEVKRDRLELARSFAADNNVTLVLKGRRSIVAAPGGKAYINMTGNPGMATAGSGDVLTGMITAFIGAGMAATDAAAAAVYMHGLSGDYAAAELGERSVRASDIIRYMPNAFVSNATLYEAQA